MQQYLPEGLMLHNPAPCYSQAELERAQQDGTILTAVATMCDAQHNLIVNLGSATGLIPYEQTAIGIAEGAIRDVAILALVGRPVCFQVQNAASSPVLLSRRAAQLKARNALFAQHHPGDILPAVVTNPARFGAFCDIGCGLVGLLGIENLSISRIRHSQERVQEGQRLFVLLRTMDPETGRVTLSHKELLGTWAQNAAAFQAGQTVTGIVRSKKDYGLFIELAPNLSGLAEPRAGLEEGDAVSVYIKSILPQKQKIKLIVLKKLDRALLAQPPIQYFETEGHLQSWQYGSSDPLTLF